MTFKPGSPKPSNSGRRKGTPNAVTRRVKETLEAVLAEPETEERLRALRDSDEPADRSTFWRLAGRCVPNEIAAKVESETTLRVIDRSDQRRDDLAEEPREASSDERVAAPSPVELRDVPRDLPPVAAPMPAPAPPVFIRRFEDFQEEAELN